MLSPTRHRRRGLAARNERNAEEEQDQAFRAQEIREATNGETALNEEGTQWDGEFGSGMERTAEEVADSAAFAHSAAHPRIDTHQVLQILQHAMDIEHARLLSMGAWDAESVREVMSGPNVPQENLQFGPDIIDDMGPLPASPSSNERLNEGPPAYVYDITAAAEQSIEIYLEMAENEEEDKQKVEETPYTFNVTSGTETTESITCHQFGRSQTPTCLPNERKKPQQLTTK